MIPIKLRTFAIWVLWFLWVRWLLWLFAGRCSFKEGHVRRCQLCWGRVRLPHVAARSRGVRVVFFFQLQKGKCCQKFTILFLWVIHTQSICKFLIAFSFLRMQKEGHVRPPRERAAPCGKRTRGSVVCRSFGPPLFFPPTKHH